MTWRSWPSAVAIALLTVFAGLPPLTEGRWHALPDDAAAGGRWEKSLSILELQIRSRTSCFIWWSMDREEWHHASAMQPLFRRDGSDVCVTYREPWPR